MRIVAGTWRGRALASLGKGDPAAHLRPTSDRVRESLFNVLSSMAEDPVTDAQVLDLFAGTGALSFEALSRGAARATLVDDGRAAQTLIQRNLALLGASDRVRVIRRDATRLPPSTGQPCSLIFLDPPYGKGLGDRALAAAQAGGWIAPGALVVWEENAAQPAPPGFAPLDTRRWGDTHVTFLRANS